jgi:hypothetical protein
VTRLVSGSTKNLFQGAIEDVELMREAVTEGAYNGGIVKGLHKLEEIEETLDWEARGEGLGPLDTTVTAGIGYCDDREDRRIDRYVSLADNQPSIGTKENDMAIL